MRLRVPQSPRFRKGGRSLRFAAGRAGGLVVSLITACAGTRGLVHHQCEETRGLVHYSLACIGFQTDSRLLILRKTVHS